ncbi:TetR/AcrR family transcriptional regulator [Arenibaculum pallidiluteum]|uniref:TetR/AcrR family transcriptional regulator n=1 Tax=Arenibaculum pallidiluteum TaxID=2812559 RepID=UPI001A96D67F|nr:TetR/AcrR family transcriptional regulator [Arenibaculum pallidiluteum]
MPGTHAKSARERILETAAELFYREGIRAVGVDTIIARSGVAKMSLYRNFASKDELARAYLEDRNELYWQWWDRAVAAGGRDARARIRAVFEAVRIKATRPEYRGCPFVNTAVEFADPDHPARAVAMAHKREQRARLKGLAEEAGARDPGVLADQLLLLMDGAYASAQTLGSDDALHALADAADALVAAAQTDAPKGGPAPGRE